MALKALVCPQCGASLSLDDEKEFGFCQFCGTKMMLHETVNVRHSGSITIDNSPQERNYLSLADSRFAALNYKDAYDYYNKTLEINVRNVRAIYMRGICAVYISDPQNIRMPEFAQAVIQAKNLALDPKNDVSADQVLKDIEQKTLAMVAYWTDKGKPVQPASNEAGECVSEFSKAVNVSALGTAAAEVVFSEACKEDIVELTLPFIEEVKKTRLQYLADVRTDKKGRASNVFKPVTLNADQMKKIKENDTHLRNIYNNLPSRVSMLGDINGRKGEADQKLDELKSRMRELKNQRNLKFLASLKNRHDPALKAEIAALDEQIKALEPYLGEAKTASKSVNSELKTFNKSLK